MDVWTLQVLTTRYVFWIGCLGHLTQSGKQQRLLSNGTDLNNQRTTLSKYERVLIKTIFEQFVAIAKKCN